MVNELNQDNFSFDVTDAIKGVCRTVFTVVCSLEWIFFSFVHCFCE